MLQFKEVSSRDRFVVIISEKIQITEGMQLPNPERITTPERNGNKFLGKIGYGTIKHTEMKGKRYENSFIDKRESYWKLSCVAKISLMR